MTASLKICVVDDERIVCDRLRPVLEKAGYRVETFTDSTSALEHLSAEGCDILITDLKMARPDGIELLKLARERLPEIRVVIITGFATVDTAREALKSGAVDFIAKPFRIGQLRDLVARIEREVRGEGS
jgi:DNA-binding NtrC family response regulator